MRSFALLPFLRSSLEKPDTQARPWRGLNPDLNAVGHQTSHVQDINKIKTFMKPSRLKKILDCSLKSLLPYLTKNREGKK